MSKKRKLIFTLGLMLAAMSCSGCSTTANFNNCPVFPKGGKQVAAELEKVPYEGYENTWEWIARLQKLKTELDLCKE